MASRSFGTQQPATPHIVVGHGLNGEVADLRSDVDAGFSTLETAIGGLFQEQEFTNPVAAAPAGLEAATATTVAPRTVTSFVAGGVAALAAFPRNITFTTAGTTPADAPATAKITGTDINGNPLTETVNVAQTGTKVEGVSCFKTITKVEYAAADGTGATVSIGFGSVFGLSAKIKLRAGAPSVLAEFAIGAKVTTGTFVGPLASAPYGSYSPAVAPDGANDYAVIFEKDLS